MTPEETAAAVNTTVTPTFVRIDPRRIPHVCTECRASVDPQTAMRLDAIYGFCTADGTEHLAALCPACITSLDAASHQETLRRLSVIRARALQ